MARIYIARTTGIGAFERHVVLKLITPERANDHTAVQMFLDEARLAASLNHQNVAQVFEVGEDGGIHYLAMEYVHGQDLRALLAKAGSQGSRIPLELALTVVAGAAAGLNHAHERRTPDGTPLGIVHRDVSPSNIMIGYDGAVKLLDFGIAKATSRSVETQSGIIKGKFAYMAPEQCRGREVDRRSDVFSLGIILYEISTQHRCFRADSDFDTMHRIVTGDVVRPTRLVQGYPQALEAIVMKALAVDAAQRYQSAGLLLEAIESFAVSSRMSLSTMGLGRFMRDMFGDVPEPWLTSVRHTAPPAAPRENTISSTNGRSTGPVQSMAAADGVVDEDGRFETSGGNSLAGQTILDLPGDRERDTLQPNTPDWHDPKAYPASQPAFASTSTMPPESLVQPMYAAPSPPPQPALGSQAMPIMAPQPPPAAFTTPPSGSGPAIPGGIPSTRHGYASPMSRGDLGYPRYEPPPAEPSQEVSLGQNRQALYLGIAVVAVGIIVVLLVTLRGGSKDDAPPAPAHDPPAETHTQVAPTPPPTSVANPDDFISIRVVSHPAGADVIVAGTKIGTTPLDKKLARGSKVTDMTVHLDGYVDASSKIDLAGDLQKEVVLAPVAPPPDETQKVTPPEAAPVPVPVKEATAPKETPAKETPAKEPVHTAKHTAPATDHVKASTPAKEHEPKTPRCQPQNAYNPFDTSCNGQPCPVCK
jgi:serine/threonine-protein kinase